jgi:choline kinase
VIDQFPADTEFVIALGHKGELVRDFVELAYPSRSFLFAEVQPFEGPGSGLGLSLLACKNYLQQPFIFTSCDTLVSNEIPRPETNWIGYASTNDLKQYRTIAIDADKVVEIYEKAEIQGNARHAYIGLAGVQDFALFWQAMEAGGDESIITGEVFGLRALLKHRYDIEAKSFKWFDTGTPEALAKVRNAHENKDSPNILEKSNEAIWFIGDQVIKFCDDKKFIANRVERSLNLVGYVPQVTDSRQNMYRYAKADGSVLSEIITLQLFDKLLSHCETFWRPTRLDEKAELSFKASCKNFYHDKTIERVELFYKMFGKEDGTEPINGVPMPTLESLVAKINWDWIADGKPCRFHGDFHFENILWNESKQSFIFLDWRQNFAGDLQTGDLYYDLAKLHHGLIVNHRLITQEHYSVSWTSKNIDFDLHRRQILVECERYFLRWIEKSGYDQQKVLILTALIYLNIAPLHHNPYSLLLYALGKSMLEGSLKNIKFQP